MYLVSENESTIVDDLVIAASNETQARREAHNYFADEIESGRTISPEWEQTSAEPDIEANSGKGARTISF